MIGGFRYIYIPVDVKNFENNAVVRIVPFDTNTTSNAYRIEFQTAKTAPNTTSNSTLNSLAGFSDVFVLGPMGSPGEERTKLIIKPLKSDPHHYGIYSFIDNAWKALGIDFKNGAAHLKWDAISIDNLSPSYQWFFKRKDETVVGA
jgi:hypothetical protein